MTFCNEGYISPPFCITQPFHEDSELMIENIKHCLDLVVNQERNCSCQFKDFVRFQTLVELTFESEKSRMLFRIIGLYLNLLNSIANPILYAFWYPDFRKYFFSLISWFKMKARSILCKMKQ